MNLLEEKGISGDTIFGYDWHWRAHNSFERKAGCPAAGWSAKLKALHTQLSLDLLEMFQLPFIITASSCTRDNLRKHLSKSAISLEIELLPPVGVLKFDLDFRGQTLRRIILHLHHPTAGFFARYENKGPTGLQLDAGINFILWLLGKAHDHDRFTRQYRDTSKRPRSIRHAPLPEMWQYVRKEITEGRVLQLIDYSPSFLSWAARYIGQDPSLVLAEGASLARAVANNIVSRIHKRTMVQEPQQKLVSTLKSSTIQPLADEIGIQYPHEKVKRKLFVRQFLHSREQSEISGYRPLVDEVEILRPLDDLLEGNDEDESLDPNTNLHFVEGHDEMATCHRTVVAVCKNGNVRLPNATHPLRFRTGRAQAKEILAAGGVPKIHFTPTSIEIRVEDKVIYEKPIERLLASLEGGAWLCQLLHEKECLQRSKIDDKQKDEAPQSDLLLISRKPQLNQGCAWKNGELKRKLLQGAKFHCKGLTKKGQVVEKRVYFRGVQITVPMEADVETVSIQASIVPEGTTHEHECIRKGGEVDDPAHRLGIMVKCNTLHGESKVLWSATSGDCNIKKLNSLVDFLEDKDDDWMESQSRRFLDKNYSRGRYRVSYTS